MNEDIILEYAIKQQPKELSTPTKMTEKDENLEHLNECYALFKHYVKASQCPYDNRVKVSVPASKRFLMKDCEKEGSTRRKPMISKIFSNAMRRYPNRCSKNGTTEQNAWDEEYSVLEDLFARYRRKNYGVKFDENKDNEQSEEVLNSSRTQKNAYCSDISEMQNNLEEDEAKADYESPTGAVLSYNNPLLTKKNLNSPRNRPLPTIMPYHSSSPYNACLVDYKDEASYRTVRSNLFSNQKDSYKQSQKAESEAKSLYGNESTATSASKHQSAQISRCSFPKAVTTLYRGPEPSPSLCSLRLYDVEGPVNFDSAPQLSCVQHQRAELRAWPNPKDVIISQNSSKRRVLRGLWLSPVTPSVAYPVAIKSVEDQNARDGRSVKREIECHLYIYSRLTQLQQDDRYSSIVDSWPSSELFGYYLDKNNPGKSVLITRKLSGPDFFDVIRQEGANSASLGITYEYHKLNWCVLALKKILQYGHLGIRHNDIKPDNIVLDFYENNIRDKLLDVKIIDLGTASMHSAKEFTGGTSWYESPEQKVLEFYSKKLRDAEKAKTVDIGLNSDVWAAGLSITEVLLGKRVVDYLKQPNGPGPLDYRGPELGWAIEPAVWVSIARKALFSRSNQTNTYSFDAAKYIYDHLVKPNPVERASLTDAINQLYHQIKKIFDKIKKTHEVN